MAEAENSDSNVEEESVTSQDLIVEDRDEQIEEMSLEARMEDLKEKKKQCILIPWCGSLAILILTIPNCLSALSTIRYQDLQAKGQCCLGRASTRRRCDRCPSTRHC